MDTHIIFQSIDYNSPQAIRELLDSRQLAVNSRYGQNFLINHGAREKLIGLLSPEKTDTVWEIGPGLGAMTALLDGMTGELVLFEIDRGYVQWLREMTQGIVEIIEGDFIKTCQTFLLKGNSPDLVLGNLPYNAASAIILKMIELSIYPQRAVFTVQNEMADRICAIKGTKEYSSFSILTQICFDIRKEGKLQSGSFYPAPRVDSAIIVLTPSQRRKQITDEKRFSLFLKGLFMNRRKTIRNQLANAYRSAGLALPESVKLEGIFQSEGLHLGLRPEEIDVDTMIRLINKLLETI
jgi:16S rRNA (adenine1518-N6/adenine1519-N6)-dimethyltransferase